MKDLSLIRYLPIAPKIKFLRLRKIAAICSIIALLGSVTIFMEKGMNYGIDFTGGTVLEIDTGQTPKLNEIRTRVNDLGLGEMGLQNIHPPLESRVDHDYVRLTIPLQVETDGSGAEVQQQALEQVKQALHDYLGPFTIRNQGVVGSKVSGELRQKGLLAVILALGMVLLYIWFRFEWQFAVGAVLALFHDVILTLGVFSLTQIEFNLSIIAAILTIVGYSLNDTVIVYDRIRENLRKYKKTSLIELLDLSINDMLSRTIMTSVTTLLALFSLYVLGGEGLRGFSFAMIWGVIVGTYSSVFIASPLLLLLKLKAV